MWLGTGGNGGNGDDGLILCWLRFLLLKKPSVLWEMPQSREEDLLAAIAVLGEAVQNAGNDDAGDTRHGRRLTGRAGGVKKIGDCPSFSQRCRLGNGLNRQHSAIDAAAVERGIAQNPVPRPLSGQVDGYVAAGELG